MIENEMFVCECVKEKRRNPEEEEAGREGGRGRKKMMLHLH